MHKIAVIGAGGWGTTLSLLLAAKGNPVDLWCYEPEIALEINEERTNTLYLPGIKLPKNITASIDLQKVCHDKHVLILAIPSQHLRGIVQQIKPFMEEEALILIASKGLEVTTQKRLSEVVQEELQINSSRILVISGPNHAEEVSRGIPTATVVAGDLHNAGYLQECLVSERFRVYTNRDLIGVELAGSLKNVITLAAGISDGLGFGDNTKAALLTRGLAEISRLGVALGANPLTFSGLAGMGDLIGTATSKYSRNLWAGREIGKGRNPQEVISSTKMVVEGFYTSKAASLLSKRVGIEMPITEQIYAVLYGEQTPSDAVKELMNREPKDEMEYFA